METVLLMKGNSFEFGPFSLKDPGESINQDVKTWFKSTQEAVCGITKITAIRSIPKPIDIKKKTD
jgi:hypothetical protein